VYASKALSTNLRPSKVFRRRGGDHPEPEAGSLQEVCEHEVQNEKITLSIKNRTEFTAGMLGEGTQSFEIMNPELLICTLDTSSKLDIEITIGKGRGYVPAEENKPKDAPSWLHPG
jgi:hypothetical protein